MTDWRMETIAWHAFDPAVNRLFLDCDGVLADFDVMAEEILGEFPRTFELQHGTDEFWRQLGDFPNFYARLPLKEDAMELYQAVWHLHPVILTGAPTRLPTAHPDKRRWVAEKFGIFQRAIVCKSSEKSNFCIPGDVIVDDWPQHRSKWEGAGGTWVHHTSAESSIEKLIELGVI